MLLTIEATETFSTRLYLRGQIDAPLAIVNVSVSNAGGIIGEYPAINAVGMWTALVTDDLAVGDYTIEATATLPLRAPVVTQGTLSVLTSENTDHLDIGNGPGSDTIDHMNPPDMAGITRTWEVGGKHPKCSARVRMFRKPDR